MPRASLDAATIRPARALNDAPAAIAGNVADGNSLTNTGRTLLLVTNANAAATARNLLIHFGQTVLGQDVEPISLDIPAGPTTFHTIGPFPVAKFGRSLEINAAHAELTFRVLQP